MKTILEGKVEIRGARGQQHYTLVDRRKKIILDLAWPVKMKDRKS